MEKDIIIAWGSLLAAMAACIAAYFSFRSVHISEKTFQRTYTGFLAFIKGDISGNIIDGKRMIDLYFENMGPGKIFNLKSSIISPSYVVLDFEENVDEEYLFEEHIYNEGDQIRIPYLIPNSQFEEFKLLDIGLTYRTILGKQVEYRFSFEFIAGELEFKLLDWNTTRC